MSEPTVENIRSRAYDLWQKAGEPEGAMDQFWYEAERQLREPQQSEGEVPPGMTDDLPV